MIDAAHEPGIVGRCYFIEIVDISKYSLCCIEHTQGNLTGIFALVYYNGGNPFEINLNRLDFSDFLKFMIRKKLIRHVV